MVFVCLLFVEDLEVCAYESDVMLLKELMCEMKYFDCDLNGLKWSVSGVQMMWKNGIYGK